MKSILIIGLGRFGTHLCMNLSKLNNEIVKRVLKDVEDGDIILMHDIFPTSVQAALELIDTLTRQGYTFVTVDELLID